MGSEMLELAAGQDDLTRDPVALAMLAAWMNCRVDQLPPENTSHLNPATMAAWKRVAEAARLSQPQGAESGLVGVVVRFLDPGIGSLIDAGIIDPETSGRYARLAERAADLIEALSRQPSLDRDGVRDETLHEVANMADRAAVASRMAGIAADNEASGKKYANVLEAFARDVRALKSQSSPVVGEGE